MALGRKTGGRQPGSPNIATSKAKDALMHVFRNLGDVEAMTKWATENQTEFYKLWTRLVPTEVHGKGFAPPPSTTDKKESDRDFARRVAYVLNAGIHDIEASKLLKEMDIETARPN